ncbi:uncharacterized protein RJT21DRAFT_122669 [Scheffersomyces amazonensis]|uniref:uncharacterized protein n=1 Tax=Scheffersomyces amazonensis TaxID=1078765 RepID=UPI00315CEE32
MGIQDLWDVLRPAFDERVSIDKFTDQFIRLNGRVPRLAIDASTFLFNSNLVPDRDKASIAIRNFMSKVLNLVALNLSIIVVFDGCFRPNKDRVSGSLESNRTYEDDLIEFKTLTVDQYKDYSFEEVALIKEELFKCKIDYLQAAGEAEAQCAQLQTMGIVDYVVTNDSDAFVFGITAVLRNFNRFKDDSLASPRKDSVSSTKYYYVTPVRMSQVEQIIGLNWERLVLLASLRGGDYSSGSKKIGITHAKAIALCGTNYLDKKPIQMSPSKKSKSNQQMEEFIPPDFSKEFLNIFLKENPTNKGNLYVEPMERKIRLQKFLTSLNSIIRSNSRSLFGRLLTLDNDLVIQEYYTMLYLFPFVDKRLYKFLPLSLSFGELHAIDKDIVISRSKSFTLNSGLQQFERINSNYTNSIGYSIIYLENNKEELQIISHKFEPTEKVLLYTPKYFIPPEFYWDAKYVIIKVLAHKAFPNEIAWIDRFKSDENQGELLRIKYDKYKLPFNKEEENDDDNLKSEASVWCIKTLIELVNKDAINHFKLIEDQKARAKKEKKSPVKAKTQKTKVDDFFKRTTLAPLPLYATPESVSKGPISFPLSTLVTKNNTNKNKKSQISIQSFFKGRMDDPFQDIQQSNRLVASEIPYLEAKPSKRSSSGGELNPSPTKKLAPRRIIAEIEENEIDLTSDTLYDLSLHEADDSSLMEINIEEFNSKR